MIIANVRKITGNYETSYLPAHQPLREHPKFFKTQSEVALINTLRSFAKTSA